MSDHIPGPLAINAHIPPGSGDAEWQITLPDSDKANVVAVVDPNITIDSLGYSAADTAELFSAAYDAFDSSARRLGVDAVDLAARMRGCGIAEMAESLKGMWDDFGNDYKGPTIDRARNVLTLLGLITS